MKKSNTTGNTKTEQKQVLDDNDEISSIFNFDKEEACYKNQWIDEDAKVAYRRQISPEQVAYNLWREKCVDPKTGKYYTNGEGTGKCLGKEGPKRLVTCITRMKASNGAEYLLSNSLIRGYNAFGDKVETSACSPEKYYKTSFRYETVPNYKTGYQERRNQGPGGSETVYTLPFTKENAQKLFDLRDNENIEFVVKNESAGRVYGVKPQITIQETFKLFTENDFNYLYNANYLSHEQKMLNMKMAEGEGLIPHQSDDDRAAAILAQESLSDKQKHIAIQ